jgi:hypothetical protein
MSAGVYLFLFLAILVLLAHLLFNAWVVFGAAITRTRSSLVPVHILSVIYGAVIQNEPWPCPLTLAETWCEERAGLVPYHGPFLLHYLDMLVYPQFPEALLRWGAVAVCSANLAIYARRYVRKHHHSATQARYMRP